VLADVKVGKSVCTFIDRGKLPSYMFHPRMD